MTNARGTQALAAVKESQKKSDGITVFSTGVRARITPIPAALIDDAMNRVKYPDIPMWHNDAKDRDEPNPSDPVYLEQYAEAERQRSNAALDTMLIAGVELVDGLPEDDRWLRKLTMMERRGLIQLEGNYDMDDELDKEFLYKRYVAVGVRDFLEISRQSGMNQEDIEAAQRTFRGDET